MKTKKNKNVINPNKNLRYTDNIKNIKILNLITLAQIQIYQVANFVYFKCIFRRINCPGTLKKNILTNEIIITTYCKPKINHNTINLNYFTRLQLNIQKSIKNY